MRTLLLACLLLPILLAADAPKPDASPTAQAVAKLQKELNAGIDARNERGHYNDFMALTNKKLDDSAGMKTWSDKTGNCRLAWVDHMLRNPIDAIGEGEAFTRELHAASSKPALGEALRLAAAKLDVVVEADSFEAKRSNEAHVRHHLAIAGDALKGSWAMLSPPEREELRQLAYLVTTGDVKTGARVRNRDGGRRTFDLLEKADRAMLLHAGACLLPLADTGRLVALADEVKTEDANFDGVEGKIRRVIELPGGKVVIGGAGKNTYQLDAMPGVCLVIDPGGDDVYEEGTLSAERPILVIADLAGNDTYRGKKPGIQGGAILGLSMLIDAGGNDSYEAEDVAQGACIGGVGILIDQEGNDTYKGVRRVQGSAIGGVAMLIDRKGNDTYRGALYAQGVGGPLGLGLLDDVEGNDWYYAGGYFLDGYDDSPGYDGWSQGCGYGPRSTANGGIGVLLDGAGDDEYECDYFSHAAGYWFAAGFARDFGGNDKRYGATRKAYDGSERKETRFLRYGVGFGCHYAIGMLFDDAGDDYHGGTMAGHGFAWDISLGVMCDFAGNDTYDADGGVMQGVGAQAGIGVCFDLVGDDKYKCASGQGWAEPKVDYHKELALGGNFSFLVDWGGTDTYSSGAPNDAVTERGSPGGMLIDRAKAP